MRKLLFSAIGCLALVAGAAGDPANNLALALKKLASPERGAGSLASNREKREIKDPFYLLTLEERLEDLDARWKTRAGLSETEKKLLDKHMVDTLLLSVKDMTGEGLATIRAIVQSIAPNLELAKMPIEDIADLIFVAGRLFKQIVEKEYIENATKLMWIAKCLTLPEKARATVKNNKTGELVCKNFDCVSGFKCVGVMGEYTIKALAPITDALVEGVEADGRRIKGVVDTIAHFASEAKNSDLAEKLKKYGRLGKLSIQMATRLKEGAIAGQKRIKGKA